MYWPFQRSTTIIPNDGGLAESLRQKEIDDRREESVRRRITAAFDRGVAYQKWKQTEDGWRSPAYDTPKSKAFWKAKSAEAAIDRAGVCSKTSTCLCPNCIAFRSTHDIAETATETPVVSAPLNSLEVLLLAWHAENPGQVRGRVGSACRPTTHSAFNRLALLGLVDLHGLTERGRVLIDAMRSLPLPVPTNGWKMP